MILFIFFTFQYTIFNIFVITMFVKKCKSIFVLFHFTIILLELKGLIYALTN